MSTPSIGIIGITGRMGNLVKDCIEQDQNYCLGPSFAREIKDYGPAVATSNLDKIFQENDYIVDFSSAHLISKILTSAISTPRPLVICTTGWKQAKYHELLAVLSKQAPIVIAPNASIGAWLQLKLIKQIARLLGKEYDIDIIEKHHRYKADQPSGTALQLANIIIEEKSSISEAPYQIEDRIRARSLRSQNSISITAIRSGNIFGEHEVSFTSEDEIISIKHQVFNRQIFAKGALQIIRWLDTTKPKPGIYTINEILE